MRFNGTSFLLVTVFVTLAAYISGPWLFPHTMQGGFRTAWSVVLGLAAGGYIGFRNS